MNYYEVLPLSKTGAEDQTFTYESEEEIPQGSLVSVPIRKRIVRGMIFGKTKKPAYQTRNISKILTMEPVLSNMQINLAKKISDYYLSPLGDTMSTILSFEFGKKRRNVEKKEKKYAEEGHQKLTPDQKKIFDSVEKSPPKSKHLIFGVTGSGKTEIYLQLVSRALKQGKGSIILIPEISLTPQTLARFEARFGERVAVWHSHLLETEKYATWQKIKSGEKNIIVGARSAIFSPIKNLGYIIIDEEHESSFKQSQNPRYEASQVAEWLSDFSGAKLVLGSATPKIDTYHKTITEDFEIHKLSKRIVQNEMPPVKIVDLTDEFRKGNKSIFSEVLHSEIEKTLRNKKQVILFVNRRGAATFVVCRDCGKIMECPRCEIPLTYHPNEGETLLCHHCDFKKEVPSVCPGCKSYAIKYFGLGTQRVETEAKKLFPMAKIARMDRDTTKKRGSHEEIFSQFSNKSSDILIGTQLVAKGWDLPDVDLVGVISADTMLNIPDFRSAEKTFSLLTQVAGRTGRGYHPGKVIIQTYSPENYAIKAAAKHDYEGFYEREVISREKYLYPPFTKIIKLTYSSKSDENSEKNAEEMHKKILDIVPSLTVLGPSPAFIPKLSSNYRWQIILKLKTKKEEEATKEFLKKNYKSGWIFDIDPENLL